MVSCFQAQQQFSYCYDLDQSGHKQYFFLIETSADAFAQED
jgi:hypothetical protein